MILTADEIRVGGRVVMSVRQSPRTLEEIAREILAGWSGYASLEAKPYIMAMAKLQKIEGEESYKAVSKARASLAAWRSKAANAIKRELETILAHYRADQW
jgi:hypothetical protein